MDLRLILAATTAADPSWLDSLGSTAWVVFSICAGLGFVIFVHELGHFLVAKACGVKCEKFYIGFDWFPISRIGPFKIPHSLFKAKWGETEYGIGILPLGGYVKMLGQDDDPRNAAAEAERAKAIQTGTAAEGLTAGTTVEKADQPVQLDPRSYPAKSVPARMAIISAGVIMNVIFAVILAAIAFKMGVDEVPAIVGSLVPGDPAWVAGLQPGDKILQFGKSGRPYEHLRFDDLRRAVVFNGADRDLPILVRNSQGKEVWFAVRPLLKEGAKFSSLGVGPVLSTELGPSEGPLGAKATPPIEKGDVVVAVGGQSIASGTELMAALARHPKGDLQITVERAIPPAAGTAPPAQPEKKRLDITVGPRFQRHFGAVMKMGPIVAFRAGSAAETAGMKVGDVIESVAGEPVGNHLTLNQRLLEKAGQTVSFTVSRQIDGKTETKEISVPVAAPQALFAAGVGAAEIEGIGVAYAASNVIASVEPNTPAAEAGLQAGDEITQVDFLPADEKSLITETAAFNVKPALENLQFKLDDNSRNWNFIQRSMQEIAPTTKLRLTFVRDKKAQTATVATIDNPELFDDTRGLAIRIHFQQHRAANWGVALQLGFRETKERLTEVLTVLSQLGSGRLSATNLSGPAGILGAARSHAAAGIAPLLLFLTLLSANLAIINFLPIPALDGGHMLFLAAEWIRGKPVDPNLQGYLSLIGVLCLLSLMVFATAMDIGRFLG